jgi:hypothetical protein
MGDLPKKKNEEKVSLQWVTYPSRKRKGLIVMGNLPKKKKVLQEWHDRAQRCTVPNMGAQRSTRKEDEGSRANLKRGEGSNAHLKRRWGLEGALERR